MFTKWVRINVVSEATGYSIGSIREKIKKRKTKSPTWPIGKYWKHAPDGRLVFNLKEIEAWMGS